MKKNFLNLSFFQNLSSVAASRQSAANLLFPGKDCGALPRRRYGVLKKAHLIRIFLPVFFAMAVIYFSRAQDEIQIQKQIDVLGQTKPIAVSLEGFSGEVADVLKFDLYVQGFSFVAPDAAQYQISGSSAGNVQGRVMDRFAKSTLLSRSYTGANPRRQAHMFADDIVQAVTGKKGVAQTKIAFKAQSSTGNGEIYVADFDGHNAQAVTHDDTIVAAPSLGAGPAGDLLHVVQTRQSGYFLPQPQHRPAPCRRGLFRLEHQRGGVAGRLESGDDFEPERQPGRVGLRRRRLEFETIDLDARG